MPLISLPVELQLRILQLVLPPPTGPTLKDRRRILKGLALVNRDWREAGQPELFRLVPMLTGRNRTVADVTAWLKRLEAGGGKVRGIAVECFDAKGFDRHLTRSQRRESAEQQRLLFEALPAGFPRLQELHIWSDPTKSRNLALRTLGLFISKLYTPADYNLTNLEGVPALQHLLLGFSSTTTISPDAFPSQISLSTWPPLTSLTFLIPPTWPTSAIETPEARTWCAKQSTKLHVRSLDPDEEVHLALWKPE
ncbi:hypothetical protein JCM10207_002443 [Rhodosporidiobolus poonsookiae]